MEMKFHTLNLCMVFSESFFFRCLLDRPKIHDIIFFKSLIVFYSPLHTKQMSFFELTFEIRSFFNGIKELFEAHGVGLVHDRTGYNRLASFKVSSFQTYYGPFKDNIRSIFYDRHNSHRFSLNLRA